MGRHASSDVGHPHLEQDRALPGAGVRIGLEELAISQAGGERRTLRRRWIYPDIVRRCATTRSSTCRLLWTKAPAYCGPPPIAAPEGRHSCRAHTRRFHQGILEPESTGDRLSKVPHELSSLFLHAQSLLFFSTARSAYFSCGVRFHIKTCCQPYPVSSSLTLIRYWPATSAMLRLSGATQNPSNGVSGQLSADSLSQSS